MSLIKCNLIFKGNQVKAGLPGITYPIQQNFKNNIYFKHFLQYKISYFTAF